MGTVHFIPRDFLQLGYLLLEAVHSNRSIGFIQVLLDYRSTVTRVASYNEDQEGERWYTLTVIDLVQASTAQRHLCLRNAKRQFGLWQY